ncbi:APC family permease [Paenibacillus glycanilyticus]|uniref:Putrescine/spermidine ABC transporter n=1 Tax=Paenibacillus glycanilyticus TaxID=126569 RepID=A0ABQ6GAC1_9BACL|nr:APC family permease [Paenibacillus glycanilyticus]GLX67899.1 putrescine/spermidine ABC transporter [Paenibacillus glycanilyticus]
MKQEVTLRQSLTLVQVVALGLAWMTPMIYFSVFGIAYDASKGMITEAYSLSIVAIFFTAYSYSIMAKIFPGSGSSYTYVKKSMHPIPGFTVGWAILLDYLFSPIIACLTFGIYLHAQFPAIPSYVWIILLNIILAVVNIAGIKFSASLSKLFVLFQIIFIALFCGYLFKGLSGVDNMVVPFTHMDASLPTLLAGASLICFSFLGFDTVSTLSEETINAKKTIPRAIMLIILIASILYITTSVLIQMRFPHLAFDNLDSAGFELMKLAGGATLGAIFTTVLIFAIFTQGLTSVTSVSRLMYVLGRDSILPKKFFGALHPKFRTPVNNIVLVTIISLLALVISLDMAVKFVSFGALTSFAFVNLSVIIECYIKRKQRSFKQTFQYLVFPLIGASFIVWLITLLDVQALTLGCVWLVVGVAYYLYRTRTSREARESTTNSIFPATAAMETEFK